MFLDKTTCPCFFLCTLLRKFIKSFKISGLFSENIVFSETVKENTEQD